MSKTFTRDGVIAAAIDALHECRSEKTATIIAMHEDAIRSEDAVRLDRDIDEAQKLIRRAKHRLGYWPEPPQDEDSRAADSIRRVREAQTTLDLALEELGWEGA